MTQRILVIRLGALGDIFLAMKPFQDIRKAYPDAHITFMTTPPFAGLARMMPWFNEVLVDERAPLWHVPKLWELWKKLKAAQFTLVFDLQNKPRTAFYYKMFFGGRGAWSGTAKGCAFPRPPITTPIHRQDEEVLQIRAAHVGDSGPLDMNWFAADIGSLNLPSKTAVLIPGCSPHLPHKRWPPTHFAALAKKLNAEGFSIYAVGTKADEGAMLELRAAAPFVISLLGQTNLPQLASVFRHACVVVGNDTGPTFLSAMVGTPTLTLMSYHTNPVLSGPKGPRCAYIKENNIADITPERVVSALQNLGAI